MKASRTSPPLQVRGGPGRAPVGRARVAAGRVVLLVAACGEPPGAPLEVGLVAAAVPASVADVVPTASAPEVMPRPRCPPEMVLVWAGSRRFCVDRYESILIDTTSGARLSPYYTPSRKWAGQAARYWSERRLELGDEKAQAVPLPPLPAWQLQREVTPKAVSRPGVVPNGHVRGTDAVVACREAGKRLCTWDEWQRACRGETQEQHPYGPTYERGRCNVFREAHPAAVLHDDASRGHTDPRLNQVTVNGKPLLRKTGATPDCASRWGDDAIYDMVGNLDEWVDNPDGEFAGGFYARSATEGCERHTSAHPLIYGDYSTGVRCCQSLPSVE
ncbi:MAG: SUMF1/EgtB/PvdO family nonheme iron enzyme [Myxococcota bacterium]